MKKKSFKDIDLRLCTMCGTCSAACPVNAIDFTDKMPYLAGKCIECGKCFEACPGIKFSFPENNIKTFKKDEKKPIGHHREIVLSYARNAETRRNGASGGTVTAMLLAALKRKLINGAIVLAPNPRDPTRPEPMLATTAEEIRAAAGSKYRLYPTNKALKLLDGKVGHFAIVALPCQVQGIRRLQQEGDPNAKKIQYIIGLFCGFNMLPEATDHLISKTKVPRKAITNVEYRAGDWPGNFSVTDVNGNVKQIPKDAYGYANLMFVPERCLACPDLTSEFADISVGDCWVPGYGSPGWNTTIIRTQEGEVLWDRTKMLDKISYTDATEEQIVKSHNHLIKYKQLWHYRAKKLGLEPVYRLPEPEPTMSEKAKSDAMLLMVRAGRKGVLRHGLKAMPSSILSSLTKIGKSVMGGRSK